MSDDETFGPLLHGTARAWRLKLDERLKPMGLSQAKWRTLLHLSVAPGPLTQAEIAALLGIEEPTLVTLLHRLESDRWVARKNSSQDRRCKTVHLAPRAQRVIEQINTARSNFDTNYSTIFRRPNFAPASACWILSDKKRKRGMEMKNEPPFDGFEVERTAKTKMGARLESGNGAATELQEPRRVKTSRVSKQRIPNWGYFLFVLLAAFAVARTLQRGVQTAKTAQPPVRPVLVAKVISKDVPLYLDEIGTCAAYETVQVQAQVSGQIIARHFQDGADVKKGDLLFTIDPRPFQAALQQAQAQAALDQVTLKRQTELRARNVTAPQDFDTAQANARKSEAAAAAAQVNVDFCYIKSPINGRAGLRLVDVGNIVSGNTGSGAVLLTIQGLDPIYTDFTVAETDLALVRKYLGGPNVKVQTYSPDDKIPPRIGDLYFIDNAVQPGSGTVKARGVTPNPDHAFWPSEFVRVRFILDTVKDALLVP